MPKNILLEAQGLRKDFPMPRTRLSQKPEVYTAVDNVSFNIYEGETFGLVGESGCGKTTIGRLLCGLIKETSGQFSFDGYNTGSYDGRHYITRHIQMIFQDPFGALNPRKPIGWLIEEPLRVNGFHNRKENRERVLALLESVGFDASYYKRYPHELSGGQRQRIAILCALILNPRLIIADEPVSALDVSVQAVLLNLMKDLQDQYGLTYLFISHDLNVVGYISDRIAVMYRGKIMEVAPTEQLYAHAQNPYTRYLLNRGILDEKRPPYTPASRTEGCPFVSKCPYRLPQCSEVIPELRVLPSTSSSGTDLSEYTTHRVACHAMPFRSQ